MGTIVDKRFAEADGKAVEMIEFERRWPDRAPAKAWSSKAVFFPGKAEADLPTAGKYVRFVPSEDPAGVWMCGGHHWLSLALDEIRAGKPNRDV